MNIIRLFISESYVMKKLKWLMLALFGVVFVFFTLPTFSAPQFKNNSKYFSTKSEATTLTKKIWEDTNKTDPVQNTDLDGVNSKGSCAELGLWATSNFTITKTLCYLKEHINDYLQYAVYFWLVAATIFLIRNWFRIVTSQDREAQMKKFIKNLKYIAIWVILITGFYYIIDVFVSFVNLVAE